MDVKEKLVIETLKKAGKPLKAGEISEISGLSKVETDKAMNSLKIQKLITSPVRCYWQAV